MPLYTAAPQLSEVSSETTREPMTWDQMREFIETHAEYNIVAYCVIGMNKLMEFIGKVERFHGITKGD
jgi:hypothetical protein